jgi:hypothetical protein
MKRTLIKALLGSFSLATALLAWTSVGDAGGGGGKTCTVTVPDKVLFGDEFYGPGNFDWCRKDFLDGFARGYGIHRGEWKGHGFSDACNTDLPMGRTYAAFVALHFTSPNPPADTKDRGGNILRWGAGFAWHTVDDLDAKCDPSGPIASCSCATFLGIGEQHITLFSPQNFYGQYVVERASTLLHEARHWNGPSHNGSNGKDSDFNFNGAWRYETNWLAWYAKEAVNAPPAQRCKAQDIANGFLSGSFDKDPGFRFDLIDCTGVAF